MKICVRQSINVDPNAIVKDLIENISLPEVSFAVIFIAPQIDAEAVCAKLKGLFNFIGCTTLANYSRKFSASSYREETATVVYTMDAESAEIGFLKDIAEIKRKYVAFSVNDGCIEEILNKVECIGGIAADDWSFDSARVFLNGDVFDKGTVAADITDYLAAAKQTCGWSPIHDAEIGVITESDGCVVKRINEQTAVDFYLNSVPNASLFGAYPVQVIDRNVFRAPLLVDESEMTISFSGPVIEGEKVIITQATRNQVARASECLLSDVREDIANSSFVIAFSCAARNQLLADLAHKEYDLLRGINSNSLLVYLYGEFIPGNGTTKLENQHIVIGIAK